jgi:hypothetical protein
VSITFTIELPRGEDLAEISRADLTFYGLDHSGASFEGRVFFNRPTANADSSPSEPGYVGSFSILGHGGCFGADGHCQVRGPVTTFDRRLPHPLEPANRVLICTDQIKWLVAANQDSVTVTVVPVVRSGGTSTEGGDVLKFDQVSLHTYE